MTAIRLGVLLDQACAEIVARGGTLHSGARMLVHPSVYRCIAQTRPRETAQDHPLLLLGLELVASEDIAPFDFRIVR
jgi:hypothetical protein